AAGGLDWRPGPVERKLEHLGGTGKLVQPVVEVEVQDLALEPAALPDREVGILPAELREVPRFAGVEDGQLAPEELEGDPVGDDVVHRQHADPEVVVQAGEEG